jgi:hypothetical protein
LDGIELAKHDKKRSNPMTKSNTGRSVSRRSALAGLGAGGLGLALASNARQASAQDSATEMAKHPMVGTWMTGNGPNELAVIHWDADGNMTNNLHFGSPGPDGTVIRSNPFAGVWEPESARGIHITFMALTFDATGAVTGTFTVDGYPVASEDGMSFWDDGTRVVVTLRDASGAVSQVIHGVPPVAGVRMAPGKPGYDEVLAMLAARKAATPTS